MLPSPIKPIFMWLPRCCCQAVGRAVHAVRGGGAAPTPLCGSPARGGKGGSLGVLGTPFAARALLLHPSVGALPVGGLFPGRALHAVRSGGAAPTPLCGSPARGGKGGSLGVLCTPFAARALLLQTFVGRSEERRVGKE